MKVLITGGAGFIGSHLAEKYLALGNDVYMVDDLSTGVLENIKHLQEDESHRGRLFVTIDSVLNNDVMQELIKTCDIVLHMAAAVGVQYIIENPLSSIITNIKGTEKVLELCNKFKKKVLIASTSEVYGKHTHAPLVETDNIIYGPSTKFRWSYAAAKLMDEFTALAYHRTKKLSVIVIRLFNTIGPRQTGRYGMVIPRFVQQALRSEDLTVYGDGSQSRTFTYVGDVVEAIIKLMDCTNAAGEVVNIGGTEEITLKDLAKRVVKLAHSTSKIKYISYDEVFSKDFEEIQRRVPSTDKIAELIKWKALTGLDDAISKVIEFYRVHE